MQPAYLPSVRNARSPHGTSSRADKITGVAVAIAMHAAVIFMLLQYAPARTALINAVPLMVSLITSEAPRPDVLPKPLPVKHLPQPRVAPPQPVLAAGQDAPSPTIVPPTPAAPVETAPTSVTTPLVSAAAPVAAAPAPVVPPNFNAGYLNNPAPAYPAIARRQGQQGRVVLRVLVNPAGTTDQAEVRVSSGHATLDRAALDAVRRWRFIPARHGDQPVAAWVQVPITFTLEG